MSTNYFTLLMDNAVQYWRRPNFGRRKFSLPWIEQNKKYLSSCPNLGQPGPHQVRKWGGLYTRRLWKMSSWRSFRSIFPVRVGPVSHQENEKFSGDPKKFRLTYWKWALKEDEEGLTTNDGPCPNLYVLICQKEFVQWKNQPQVSTICIVQVSKLQWFL